MQPCEPDANDDDAHANENDRARSMMTMRCVHAKRVNDERVREKLDDDATMKDAEKPKMRRDARKETMRKTRSKE